VGVSLGFFDISFRQLAEPRIRGLTPTARLLFPPLMNSQFCWWDCEDLSHPTRHQCAVCIIALSVTSNQTGRSARFD